MYCIEVENRLISAHVGDGPAQRGAACTQAEPSALSTRPPPPCQPGQESNYAAFKNVLSLIKAKHYLHSLLHSAAGAGLQPAGLTADTPKPLVAAPGELDIYVLGCVHCLTLRVAPSPLCGPRGLRMAV